MTKRPHDHNQSQPGQHQQRSITTPTGSFPGYKPRAVKSLPPAGQMFDMVWEESHGRLCVWDGSGWRCTAKYGICIDYVICSDGCGDFTSLEQFWNEVILAGPGPSTVLRIGICGVVGTDSSFSIDSIWVTKFIFIGLHADHHARTFLDAQYDMEDMIAWAGAPLFVSSTGDVYPLHTFRFINLSLFGTENTPLVKLPSDNSIGLLEFHDCVINLFGSAIYEVGSAIGRLPLVCIEGSELINGAIYKLGTTTGETSIFVEIRNSDVELDGIVQNPTAHLRIGRFIIKNSSVGYIPYNLGSISPFLVAYGMSDMFSLQGIAMLIIEDNIIYVHPDVVSGSLVRLTSNTTPHNSTTSIRGNSYGGNIGFLDLQGDPSETKAPLIVSGNNVFADALSTPPGPAIRVVDWVNAKVGPNSYYNWGTKYVLADAYNYEESNAAHNHGGGGGGIVDHGSLSGLGDDDHPQYATDVDLNAHLTDATDAHDASAISIVDAGGYFIGVDVEAALQELGAGGGGGGHTIHDEVAAALTARSALHFMGAGVTALDNAGASRTEVIIPTVFDAVVDSNDTNAADKGNVYSTLQAAVDAGHKTIAVRSAADSSDVVVGVASAVERIFGLSAAGVQFPRNLRIDKPDVVVENLQFSGWRLTLKGERCVAFACAFTGSITPGTALVNNAAGITSTATSIAFDGGTNGGIGSENGQGYAIIDNEVIAFPSGGNATAGTLTIAASRGRGALETLNESHADNATITDMNRGHVTILGSDCQVIQCRFVGCVDAYLPCIWSGPAKRTRVTSNVFLLNQVWALFVSAPDTSIFSPAADYAHNITANFADGNTCHSSVFEFRPLPSSGTGSSQRTNFFAGNVLKGHQVPHIYGINALMTISGNAFDCVVPGSVSGNSAQMLVNKPGGITASDTVIPADTLTGTGIFPYKGMFKIENEEVYYSALIGGNFLGCIRGANGTTAAAHADNTAIVNRSQQIMHWFGDGAAVASLANIVSGNLIYGPQIVSMRTTYFGALFPPVAFTANFVRGGGSSTQLRGGNAYTYSGNLFSNFTLDFESQAEQALTAGICQGITFANPATDTAIFTPSVTSTGLATSFGLPADKFFGLGRAGGDKTSVTIPLINRTGANSVAGDVVRIDTANDNSFIKTGSAGATDVVGVVVQGGVADGSPAMVAIAGVVDVTCTTAAVNRGDRLQMSGTAGQAEAGATAGSVFAKALTAKGAGSSGTVRAVLWSGA